MVGKQNQMILLAVTVGSILLMAILIMGYCSQFPNEESNIPSHEIIKEISRFG